MPIVAVTGATGKSGQYFVMEFQKHHPKDYQFRFLVRHSTSSQTGNKGRELLKEIGGEIYEADITKLEELDGLFVTEHGKKVDTLLHIASVLWSPYIVPVALKHGASRLILVHTTGIYSKYKAAGEAYRVTEREINRQVEELRRQGKDISVTYLRPTMIYGDLEDGNISVFMQMVYKLRLMPVINGAKYDLQPVWCGDLGKAYYDVLVNPEKTNNGDYILSGGAPIQLIDIFKIMAKELGVKNGDGPLRSVVEEASHNNRKIIYYGRVSNAEMLAIQGKADLLVCPRKKDDFTTKYTFPSKVLEYICSGVPVLSNRLPGIPDEYEQYITFAKSERPKDWATAINDVFTHNEVYREKAESARKEVLIKKSWHEQTRRVIETMCNHRVVIK